MISPWAVQQALIYNIIGTTQSMEMKSEKNPEDGSQVLRPPRVFSGYITRMLAGEDQLALPDYPSICVQIHSCRYDVYQGYLTLKILVGCFDDGLEFQGFQDVVNVMTALTETFRGTQPLRDKTGAGTARLNNGELEWETLDSQHPLWFGAMTTKWDIPSPQPQEDPYAMAPYTAFHQVTPNPSFFPVPTSVPVLGPNGTTALPPSSTP